MKSTTLSAGVVLVHADTLGVVGRIYEDASASAPPDMRWFWSVLVTPATPGLTNGTPAARRGDGEVSGGVGEGGRCPHER
jgi:hypothetical protein